MLISGSGRSHGESRLGLKSGFRHGICWGLTSREGGGEDPESGPLGGVAAVGRGVCTGWVSAPSLISTGEFWH